jgi:aminoglycoside 3-N-acetyltransferase
VGTRELQQALSRLGVPRGGVLFVHSAFRGLAREGLTPGGVLDDLEAHVGDGLLLLPTMSWRFVKAATPEFSELDTPSNVGVLTELFRTGRATCRSLHPTHSVAGKGRDAAAFLGEHHLDETPCAARSPFGKLVSADAWILMLNIGFDCCTLVHHGEEIVAPDLYLRPREDMETYRCRDRSGRVHLVRLRRHLLLARDYYQFQDMLAVDGTLRVTFIGNAVCRAFRARDLHERVVRVLSARPDAILARPGQRYRMM